VCDGLTCFPTASAQSRVVVNKAFSMRRRASQNAFAFLSRPRGEKIQWCARFEEVLLGTQWPRKLLECRRNPCAFAKVTLMREKGEFPASAADTCSTTLEPTDTRPRENFKATFGWAREIFSRCAPKSTTASELLSLKCEQRCESCLSLFAPCVVCALATHSRYARIIGEDSLVLALCCRSQVDAQCRSADEMPYTEEVYTAEE
jgi:hypothetical protein